MDACGSQSPLFRRHPPDAVFPREPQMKNLITYRLFVGPLFYELAAAAAAAAAVDMSFVDDGW